MTVSDRLIASAKDLFEEFYQHPFVTGIMDGSLPKEKFQYYMIQDYRYLLDYAKVFALGVAKAQDLESLRNFSSSVYGTLNGEMDIHRAYMKRLGISEEEIMNTPSALDNISYTSYMLRVAYEGGPAEVTASILSCAVSYEYIARQMMERNPEADKHPFYGEWVAGYISDQYRKETEDLVDLINRLTKDYSEEQIRNLENIFVTCSRYEKGFWDMGWEMRK